MTTSSYVSTRPRVANGRARTNDAVSVIKILSNKNRYAILKTLLSAKRDLCVHELSEIIGISQSATSHCLAYLEARDVVRGVRMGKTMCYEPTNVPLTKKVEKVIKSLK